MLQSPHYLAMGPPHDNDNDIIFQFDSDNHSDPSNTPGFDASVLDIPGYISSQDDHERGPILSSSAHKGKSVVTSSRDDADTEFAHFFPEPFSLSPSTASPLSQSSDSSSIACILPIDFGYTPGEALRPQNCSIQLGHDSLDSGKGKEKEELPFSASLEFNLPELDSADLEYPMWPSPRSPTPGPSHQDSPLHPISSPPRSRGHKTSIDCRLQGDLFTLKRTPSRRRSLSSLSLFTANPHSMLRVKTKWNVPRIQNNIARTFLFKKRQFAKEQEEGSPKADLSDPIVSAFDPSVLQYSNDVLHTVQLDGLPSKSSDQPLPRTKGRSKSLPQPLSALDYVPTSSLDIYEPIPLVIRNYFDDDLPRELRLHVFRSLVDLHELDFQRLVASGKWTFSKASSTRGQWIGREKGVRELFKFSRVSKSWQELVFDGQLWASFDLRAFPGLPESALLRLSQSSSSFVQSLNLAGHVQLHANVFINIADNLCISSRLMTRTQLTTIDLQGCASLATRSLHHLLILSESLQILNVKGLNVVTNTTCDILSAHCPSLTNLNMSKCQNVDGQGIQRLASAALRQGRHLKLKTLRVSGLKSASDGMMATLGKAAPFLEALDLSYVRQLHNSAIDAFVSCNPSDKAENLGVEVISVTAREAGRETGNKDRYYRRVTRLRHINISHCILLTDVACSNLAYSVPRLEFFEMAGIGTDLKDDGLFRLFKTTPHIRRVDLEDASDVTDRTLQAVTPDPDADTSGDTQPSPQPGHALECLIISQANHVSDDAFLALIQNCPRLTCLEADNTRMSAAVLREFVELSRERNISNARIVAVDCRGISDNLIKDLSGAIRPRMGWRSHAARKLMYLDARDENADELKIGQDECDEKRVVVKSFYTWQTVDAVRSAREKRRRSTKRANGDGSDFEDSSWRTRWWSPSGRRLPNSGRDTPQSLADSSDGCRVM